ncbi:IS3 family transposase [Ideonella sp. B508-1]|uniref:IS3 family transposase n=1 Tax=Ideonella sp. B508-1 TaxID=137716 RepID=UPI00034C0192|nr:IS3 family transposase [Ideonella sp. B508-1]
MYSYEDRLRAVQLYIKLDKRIGLTIRQLGYPTKNALKAWYREYEQSQALRAGYTRPAKFSQAEKERAVEHCLEHGRCIAVTIKALGYPCQSLLSAWLQELHPQRTRVVGRSQELALEAKQSAVIALCTRPASAQAVADQVGVSRGSLYKWKNQILGHDAPASMKRKQGAPVSSDRADLEQQLETLRQDIRRLRLEKDVLKKANELLKKELGIDQQPLTNREKTLLVDALRSSYSVTELLCELDLPRSSYFYHRARLGVADKYASVRQAMTDIFERNYGCYGYRRLHASLSDQCVRISEKVVRRLMKQERLVAATSKRRRYGSYMGEISPAPDNVLNRDFSAGAPNEKWLTDITEFQIPAGKVYLSPMIDCFDGMVVSWSIGTRPNAELVNTMLDAAIEKVAASGERPVVHSDRGGHYRWPGWLARIADAKLVRSMSRKGCSPDNAACEGFFGRLKTEMFFARDWLSTSIEDFIAALDAYIRWYNEARIKGSLGFRSPAQHRQRLGIAA